MLDMADVDEVHFAASDFVPGEAGGAGERFFCFSGERVVDLLPAEWDVGECVVFRQAGGRDRLAFVAAAVVQVAEFEGVVRLARDIGR